MTAQAQADMLNLLKDYNEIFVKAHLHTADYKISSLSLKRK
jgi:hypothetical protein